MNCIAADYHAEGNASSLPMISMASSFCTVRVTPPLLLFHDRDDPLLPYHNALDLTRVWKNSELIGTLGTSHHSILDDPAAIRATLSFFRAAKQVNIRGCKI
jgi:pimeloyl-ACP methyl ester carboxylesterase